MKRRNIIFGAVLSALVSFALCQQLQAAQDTPDPGSVPGLFNTADGDHALFFNDGAFGNSAFGWFASWANSAGNFNTAVGAAALDLNGFDRNTAVGAAAMLLSQGSDNTAVGAAALENNNADGNTATGAFALFANMTGNHNAAFGDTALVFNMNSFNNTAVGAEALFNNDVTNATTANNNTAVGWRALRDNMNAGGNTAVGSLALRNNDNAGSGNARFNTAVGGSALFANTEGESNTAVGFNALESNLTGNVNTAVGDGALALNTAGGNTAVGATTLNNNDTGSGNNAFGYQALALNVDGSVNVAMGNGALFNNVSSIGNVAIGHSALNGADAPLNTVVGFEAGQNLVALGENIYIGDSAGTLDNTGANPGDESAVIRIGSVFSGFAGCFINGIYGQSFGPADMAVRIGSDGKLGTVVSSRRFKHDIKPMDNASEVIRALKPVTFHYNNAAEDRPASGLIAEDVAEVSPDLVIRDKEGKPLSVRYEDVNVMLLNEFLKEHKKVEEQQASITELKSTVAQQQKGMETLTVQLKEQAAQIQKVSAQVEVSKPAPQVVTNKP